MRLAAAIGVISAVATALLIRSAIAVGFTVFIAPIVVIEVAFLGALYVIWRGLGGEHAPERSEAPQRDFSRRAPRSPKPQGVPRRAPELRGRSLVGRTGG